MITRILPIGDTHCGLGVGLLPKGYKHENGKPYVLGPSQKLVWKEFKWIEKHCMDGCDELILVLMSDLVHGPDFDQRLFTCGFGLGQVAVDDILRWPSLINVSGFHDACVPVGVSNR